MMATDGMLTPRPTLSARASSFLYSEPELTGSVPSLGVESVGVVLETGVLVEPVIVVKLEDVELDVVEFVAIELVVEDPGSKIPLLSRENFAAESLLQQGVSPLRQQ